MRRKAWTLLLMIGFSASLLATSKAPVPKDKGDAGGSSTTGASSKVRAALPDTASWTAFSFPDAKLTAKTPPGAKITCTNQGNIVVCVVMRGRKMLGTFSKGGSSVAEMADEMRAPSVGTFKILHDAPNEFIIHRDDPKYGSFCEYAVESPAKLRSVSSLVGRDQDPSVFKMIALEDKDCLDAVALARTIEIAP